MPVRPALLVLPDAGGVYGAAARLIADGLAAAIDARGVAHWSTTGGSAAPGIYLGLLAPPLRDAVDWSRVHAWWGDDRFVTSGDTLSNVRPFDEILLAPGGGLPIPAANVHPIGVAAAIELGEGPEGAAAAYAAELAAAGPGAGLDGDPAFDVLVLGVGPDGHILSVFPWSPAWDASTLVTGVAAPTHVEPHVPRVTIHPRLVAAARSVVVVTAGASKADVMARAWAGGDLRELPLRATLLPQATWVLDEAAATGLPSR
jgi:6-phosphogluconolactonase